MPKSRPQPPRPDRRRSIRGSFSWIDHRFLREGFDQGLTRLEKLLYFVLVAVSNQDGVSFYSDARLAELLDIRFLHELEAARNVYMANCYFAKPDGMQRIVTSLFFMLLISKALLILTRHKAFGLDVRSIHEDFRTFEIVQKAKRGELEDHMKTKNADSRHGRVVDLSESLAAVLREFVGGRTSGLVFCKPDGSQLMQRDVLKHSLHPILKKLGLGQGGFNIFRRFRITELETAEVPAALQHTWSGHVCPRSTKNS